MSIRSELEKFPLIAVSKKIKKANSIIPKNMQWGFYIASLIVSDAMMTFFAFWVAYYFRFVAFEKYFDQAATVSFATYRFLLFSMPFLWLLIFAINGLYVKDNLLGGTQEYSKVFRSAVAGFLMIVIAGFLGPSLVIARGWLLMTWLFTFFFVASARFLLRRLVYALRKHGFFLTPAVIVGANQEGRWLAEQLLKWETSGLHLVGFVDKKTPVTFPYFLNISSK